MDGSRLGRVGESEVEVDLTGKAPVLVLSQIFQWYAGDFAPLVAEWIGPYLAGETLTRWQALRDRAPGGLAGVALRYKPYNWALNSA